MILSSDGSLEIDGTLAVRVIFYVFSEHRGLFMTQRQIILVLV